jgi:hypothetical protein
VTALAFTPGGDLIAVGDSAGNLFLGSPRGAETLRSARISTAVTAIAFSADASLLAAADAAGELRLWNVVAPEAPLARATLSEPARWIGFDETPGGLLVATDEWLHALMLDGGNIAITATRMRGNTTSGAAAIGRTGPAAVRIAEATAGGGAASREIPLRRPAPAASEPPEWRNWAAILALTLEGDTGSVRPATD